ncbi:MAG: NAD(P)-dependent oxidoreductase [Vicinamibacterales bacterium]|nr:NAD(P)-dependent oxidoreductase [Vicinamibacterales bacterium]
MNGPIVVTGAAGQLSSVILGTFGADVPVVGLRRDRMDIADARAVERVLGPLQPAVVINCASYNDVDGAETSPVAALETNAFGVRTLARVAGSMGSLLVHYSTDFVFDGTGTAPAAETDVANPRSVYGASKLLGEWFALEAPGAYVLRVESLFGAGAAFEHRSSLSKIVTGLERGTEVPVFTDRTVSPSYVVDVAAATRAIIARRPAPGLYHCVNGGAATWEEVALEAARQLGREPRLRRTTVADVALPAQRPQYCALSNAKLAAAGITMPTWQDALRRYLAGRGQATTQ